MAAYLDIDAWNRKEQFLFFREFEQPFFNICVDVDVTRLLGHVRQYGLSFFLTSLYLTTKAANAIEAFRYRLREKQVLIHDTIHAGSTVLNPDESFTFGYFNYTADFGTFYSEAEKVLETIKTRTKNFDPRDERDDLIHYSVIPWLSFRSFSHARRFGRTDSVPKIVFGKYFRNGQKIQMPVSVEVHHALMDGVHVGKFVKLLQKLLDDPETMRG